MNRFVKGRVRSRKRIEGEGANDIGGAEQPTRVGQCQGADSCGSLGSVDQGEAFLRGEEKRLQSHPPQCVRAGKALAADHRLTLAHQGQSQVRQRREIPRGANRPQTRHNGMDTRVEQIEHPLHHQRTAARVTGCENVGSEQKHGADNLFAEGLADTAGVRTQEVELELLKLIRGDTNLGEPPETGVDPICDLAGREDLVDDPP